MPESAATELIASNTSLGESEPAHKDARLKD